MWGIHFVCVMWAMFQWHLRLIVCFLAPHSSFLYIDLKVDIFVMGVHLDMLCHWLYFKWGVGMKVVKWGLVVVVGQ